MKFPFTGLGPEFFVPPDDFYEQIVPHLLKGTSVHLRGAKKTGKSTTLEWIEYKLKEQGHNVLSAPFGRKELPWALYEPAKERGRTKEAIREAEAQHHRKRDRIDAAATFLKAFFRHNKLTTLTLILDDCCQGEELSAALQDEPIVLLTASSAASTLKTVELRGPKLRNLVRKSLHRFRLPDPTLKKILDVCGENFLMAETLVVATVHKMVQSHESLQSMTEQLVEYMVKKIGPDFLLQHRPFLELIHRSPFPTISVEVMLCGLTELADSLELLIEPNSLGEYEIIFPHTMPCLPRGRSLEDWLKDLRPHTKDFFGFLQLFALRLGLIEDIPNQLPQVCKPLQLTSILAKFGESPQKTRALIDSWSLTNHFSEAWRLTTEALDQVEQGTEDHFQLLLTAVEFCFQLGLSEELKTHRDQLSSVPLPPVNKNQWQWERLTQLLVFCSTEERESLVSEVLGLLQSTDLATLEHHPPTRSRFEICFDKVIHHIVLTGDLERGLNAIKSAQRFTEVTDCLTDIWQLELEILLRLERKSEAEALAKKKLSKTDSGLILKGLVSFDHPDITPLKLPSEYDGEKGPPKHLTDSQFVGIGLFYLQTLRPHLAFQFLQDWYPYMESEDARRAALSGMRMAEFHLGYYHKVIQRELKFLSPMVELSDLPYPNKFCILPLPQYCPQTQQVDYTVATELSKLHLAQEPNLENLKRVLGTLTPHNHIENIKKRAVLGLAMSQILSHKSDYSQALECLAPIPKHQPQWQGESLLLLNSVQRQRAMLSMHQDETDTAASLLQEGLNSLLSAKACPPALELAVAKNHCLLAQAWNATEGGVSQKSLACLESALTACRKWLSPTRPQVAEQALSTCRELTLALLVEQKTQQGVQQALETVSKIASCQSHGNIGWGLSQEIKRWTTLFEEGSLPTAFTPIIGTLESLNKSP